MFHHKNHTDSFVVNTMRHIFLILIIAETVSQCLAGDITTTSPKKTFKIVQHGEAYWTETIQFAKGENRNIGIEYGISWPASFYISPDEQWILRVQKSGSGDNISYIYRIDEKRRVWRMEQQIGRLGFEFIKRETGLSESNMYHTGIDFVSWDIDGNTLNFRIHASIIRKGSDHALDRALTYNLITHTISGPTKTNSKH